MDTSLDLIAHLTTVPIGTLIILLALAAIGLAAFAIHVVHSTIKDRERR